MNLFQIVSLIVLAGLILGEFKKRLQGRSYGLAWGVRLSLWVLAAVAISLPNRLTDIAGLVGIERGSDLVLYVFVLGFLGTTFYFYSRYVRLERKLTDVIRHIAIQHPDRGRDSSPSQS